MFNETKKDPKGYPERKISDHVSEMTFFGQKGFVQLKVVVVPMTTEEARKEFPYRPNSDDMESRWGKKGDALCKMCKAPTNRYYLSDDGTCPDCNGVAEYHNKDPRMSADLAHVWFGRGEGNLT